jgi:uncharacterized membrane protein required for colicin V production
MNNNNNSNGGDKQLIDLINGLTLAIQRGEITLNQQQQNKNQSIPTFANVNNLSNQTFNYIINWLKQQSQTTASNGVSNFHSFKKNRKTQKLCNFN